MRALTEVLFSTSPFKENRRSFNVGRSARRSRVRHFATVDRHLSRLAARRDLRRVRIRAIRADVRQSRVATAAQFAPYEFIEVLVNGRTYGGGGIFNLYSTVASDNAFANYVFVHEFGHHFAGLATSTTRRQSLMRLLPIESSRGSRT
jgi:hypothetical protein